MANIPLPYPEHTRFSFGSHETFPLRYGWLEKFAINRLTTTDKVSINIDAKNMIKEFGLGRNMADSLSFWLKQCRLVEMEDSKAYFSDFAKKYFAPKDGIDLYLENIEIADKQKSESQKKLEEFDNLILETKVKAKNIVIEAKTKITEDIKKKRDAFEKEINSEIKIAEDEIKDLMSNSPKKINQIAVDTASDLIKELIGTEVNKSSISAIVDDLSKKDKDKYYGV